MRKNQSEFIKIQPFIQTLRPSLHLHKDTLIEPLSTNPLINSHQALNFKPRQKSLSKSKILRATRKISIGTNLKQIQKNSPQCIYSQNQLEINFNKICTPNLSTQSYKVLQNNKQPQNSLDIREVKISVVLSKSITQHIKQINPFLQQKPQKPSETSNIKIKLQITCFQLSIQDQSKVKRTFDINLIQTLSHKQFLQIQISEGFKPELLILNQKIITPKKQETLPLRQQSKVSKIKPWELANQRKSLLQDKILSERPKSKIKWSFSLTSSSDPFGKSDSKFGKTSQIQQNYGLKTSQESSLKFSLELKSRSNLNLNMQKQNPYMNVFSPHVEQEIQSNSMKSTFESEERSSKKKNLGSSNELKRVNNVVASMNFREKKLKIRQDLQEESKPLRPKSSFKNLKEKNNYFLMKESERKRSMKQIGSLMEYEKNKMGMKSSEIKQEYGIS